MWAVLGLAALAVQGSVRAQTRELATQGELLDRVVAIVNDGVVLNSDLDAQVESVSDRLRQQKLELPPQNVLRQQVLERCRRSRCSAPITPASRYPMKC